MYPYWLLVWYVCKKLLIYVFALWVWFSITPRRGRDSDLNSERAWLGLVWTHNGLTDPTRPGHMVW